MTDIALKFDKTDFDINFYLGDFKSDDGLETAVNISLWTDRRCAKEELPRGETDRRGWWGDLYSLYEVDAIGSRLWLLSREKLTEETRNRAEEYAADALKWLVDDGIASSLDVVASLESSKNLIGLDVKITRPKTRDVLFYRFQLVWDAQTLKARRA